MLCCSECGKESLPGTTTCLNCSVTVMDLHQEEELTRSRRKFWIRLDSDLFQVCSAFSLLVFAAYYLVFGWPLNYELVGAASRGDASEIRSLLRFHADPNAKHREGSSALWWAVSSGSPEAVQVLLENGADPNSRGQSNSVIEQAAGLVTDSRHNNKSYRAIVQALLDRSAQIKDPAQAKLLKDSLLTKRDK